MNFNGLNMGLGNISKLSNAKTRSITAENVYGEKGKGGMAEVGDIPQPETEKIGQGWENNKCARDLGKKWKVRPCISLEKESVTTIMDVDGPACIQHIWITVDNKRFRDLIIRVYWDGEEKPSVESPVGDFFCNGFCYKQDYTIVDDIKGKGHFVGTYMAWQQNNIGWWGEGEIKIFMDGDGEFPTICGTGTEDYFGGAWCFHDTYSAPYMGYPLGVKGEPRQGDRHGLYRFHILDPIRFEEDLKVDMQAIGWRHEGRYLPLQDDISSVAYWYQAEPHNTFPQLPDRDYLEVI